MVAIRATATAAMATEMVAMAVATVAAVAMAVATMAIMATAVGITTIATKTAAVESNMAMIRQQIQQQLEQRHKRMVVVFGRVQWEMVAPW